MERGTERDIDVRKEKGSRIYQNIRVTRGIWGMNCMIVILLQHQCIYILQGLAGSFHHITTSHI